MSRLVNEKTDMKSILTDLVRSGLKQVQPETFMPASIKIQEGKLFVGKRSFSLKKRIFVIGAGKAVAAMAVELEKIVGVKNIVAGLVISNDRSRLPKKIKVHFADHPLPSRAGIVGVKKILSFKQKYALNEKDLIITLISGGGSSLMPYPIDEITLADKKKLTKKLLLGGKNGYEIPTVKRKLSKVKGGRLAKFFHPTPIVSLVLSDVLNDDLATIASGPFTPDSTSFKDAWNVIKDVKNLPHAVVQYIKKNKCKKDKREKFKHVYQKIVASNATALKQIQKTAQLIGLDVVMEHWLQKEAKDEARAICQKLSRKKLSWATLYLFGAEMSVDLGGKDGRGGRNQEFILACLDYLRQRPFKYDWAIMSFATDGIDYINESSGGIIDKNVLDRVAKQKMDIRAYLDRHDSYRALTRLKANFRIHGHTGTNVCDIVMVLLRP